MTKVTVFGNTPVPDDDDTIFFKNKQLRAFLEQRNKPISEHHELMLKLSIYQSE